MKMTSSRKHLEAFAADCSGATAIEYAVMTFIAVGIIALVYAVGDRLVPIFEAVLPGLA